MQEVLVMIQLSDEQLNNLGKEALIVIVSSLQDQLLALQSQLDHANAQLSDNNRQIELLTEQIRIMNQRFFGRKSEASVSEVDGQISLFDSFNEVEYLNQNSSKEPEITEVIIPSYHRKKSVGKRDAVIKSTDVYLSLIYDRLHELIYDSKVIHADESPVKVMRIDHTKIKNGKKTYMWVYRNRPLRGTHPIVLFDWQPSRHSDHPREFLKTFSGTVVTDGYQVYHKLAKERRDLKVAGCWVHARRPFVEFIKSVGQDASKGSIAQEAYSLITEIMHIDNTFDDLSATERKKQRQLVLSEKVDAYFAWAKQKYSQVTHNSTIGKALAYSINQEDYLRVLLSDGNVPMDNNYAEQAIRPFTIGRKNFIMIESSNGAKASAILYSLVETAKANMINTFEYFNLLLTEIPQHMDDKDFKFIDDLLPWSPRVQKECPSRYKKS